MPTRDAGPVAPVTVAGDPFSVTDFPEVEVCVPDDEASAAVGKTTVGNTAAASATASVRVSEADTTERLKTEVPFDQRRDVGDRPLLAGELPLQPAADQRRQRVPRRQRAVAAAADVPGAAPVRELDARRGRQQHLAGSLARERVPDPSQGVRELVAAHDSVDGAQIEDLGGAGQAPAAAAQVRQLLAGREPQLRAGARDDRLVAFAPDDVLDPV